MKLGFVSAILADYSFEQMIDFAHRQGFACVEVACWPRGKAQRRYAGVTHLDTEELTPERIAQVRALCAQKNVEISALAYYPNTLDPDPEKRRLYTTHLKKLIQVAPLLGVNTITTFIGKIKDKTVEENLIVFEQVWAPIIKLAEENNVKIAIENCPMLFTNDQWPGGENLATSPAIWRKLFAAIPSDSFGLNYDPSHFVWQMMDYIKPIYEFKDKIFHVHFKDIKLYRDKLDDVGILATPLQYMTPKLPGLGDVDWGRYVSALTDIGYEGYACIEVEDRAFESSIEAIEKSIVLSKRYLEQFV